jgi:23S rRNA (guanosine2251-2'-O)-methyltransferase
LSRLVAEHCDYRIKIPMRGKVASLNAAAAVAVVLFEAARQRSKIPL